MATGYPQGGIAVIRSGMFHRKRSIRMKRMVFCRIVLMVMLFPLFPDLVAQTVSTFITGNGLNGPDGFALDTAGNLFVANWGGGYGTTVLRITPGGLVSTFDSASDAPDGLAFDQSGNLYVSNYNNGTIDRVTPSGVKTQFASGLIRPSAMAFDTAGNLYVSNYGSTTVSRITPEGTVSTYAGGFSGPLGLVFDPAGNLYVSNYNTGKVHKVAPDGTTTVFATVPDGSSSRIQYLARGQSGNLYLPSYGHHKIYRISPAGVVDVLAGTGVAGSANGPAATAQFNGPNSIVLTSGGDLLVSEYNASRIRRIAGVEFPVGTGPSHGFIPSGLLPLNIFPNPSDGLVTVAFPATGNGRYGLVIRDTRGRVVSEWQEDGTARLCGPDGVTRWLVDLGALLPGVFFCSLLDGGRVVGMAKMIRRENE